jgi:hypothetical protein
MKFISCQFDYEEYTMPSEVNQVDATRTAIKEETSCVLCPKTCHPPKVLVGGRCRTPI